jgi:hypothetical protein
VLDTSNNSLTRLRSLSGLEYDLGAADRRGSSGTLSAEYTNGGIKNCLIPAHRLGLKSRTTASVNSMRLGNALVKC